MWSIGGKNIQSAIINLKFSLKVGKLLPHDKKYTIENSSGSYRKAVFPTIEGYGIENSSRSSTNEQMKNMATLWVSKNGGFLLGMLHVLCIYKIERGSLWC